METSTYRIQYIDNTFQLVEWTDEEFLNVYAAMNSDEKVALVNRCIFKLPDIRAIVFIPAITPEEEEDKKDKVITPEGAYEKELFELLKSQGFLEDVKILGERKGE